MKSNTLEISRMRYPWRPVAWALALCAVGGIACGNAVASDLMGPLPAYPQAFPAERPLANALRKPLVTGTVIRASGDGAHHPSHHPCRECGGVCRAGGCPAHCPTRPDTFGFYSTQWRTWPGAGVVQAANVEAFTPATPPRSEVPGIDEESRAAAPEEMPLPEAAPAPQPTPLPAPAARPALPPTPPPADRAAEPAPPEETKPSAPEVPADTPAPPKPAPLDEENLFDEALRTLPRTQLLAQLQADAARQADARRRAIAERRSVRQDMPRVIQATHEATVADDAAASRRINPLR